MSESPEFRKVDETFITTPDIDLAVCLATLGVPFYPPQPFFKVRNTSGIEITHFNFQERSDDGKYDTRHLVRCWEDKAFAAANGEHPIIFMKYGFMNRKRLLDRVLSEKPFVTIKRRHQGKDYTAFVREGSKLHAELVGGEGK